MPNRIFICYHLILQVLNFALQNWYAKTPLGKKRAKAAQGDEDDGAKGKGKGGKKGKKGKKK